MPLRLDSITRRTDDSLITWILQNGTQECNSAFATEDKKYIHIRRRITDSLSGNPIGQLVFTTRLNEEKKQIEMLDIDITLDNDSSTAIRFLNRREGSTDANEYYDVETVEDESHLVIETVNRHTVPQELVDTEREVSISMFPFRVSVYQNIEEFDREAGIKEPIRAGESDFFVHGFSEKFCMPGGMFDGKDGDDSYSFVIGKVHSFADVTVDFGPNKLPFVLAKVDTAAGVVPVAMGRDVFDLSNLTVGCIVAMDTVVKADVAAPGAFDRN